MIAWIRVGILISLSLFTSVCAQKFPARGFSKILNKAEAEERLNSYRNFILQSIDQESFHQAYSFKFRFRHMPRRGIESELLGWIAGPRLGSGIFRIELENNNTFLVMNPQNPTAWMTSDSNRSVQVLTKDFLFRPIVYGLNQTFFDLMMPFVFWPEDYLKSGKVSGRPAHIYQFSIPAWVSSFMPTWHRVTLALDDTYQAPLRVEIYSSDSRLIRTTSLRSYKKVGGEWIIKSLDCINQEDRSNTRLEILGAAVDLDLSRDYFSKTGFHQPLPISIDAYQFF